MSFGGLILTNLGRNKIAGAISEDTAVNFTHVKLGDGVYNGSFSGKTELTNEVMEIPITNVIRKDDEVIINCDWNSKNAPQGFYLREIGIIGNDVLCYYDNAGPRDAEYIDPGTEVIAKQKRLRFTLLINSEVCVTTYIGSGLYALAEELQAHIDDRNNPHNTLSRTGGTLTGNAKIARSGDGASPQWIAERTDTNVKVWCGVGYGGVNHGVYSDTLEKWIAYADDTGGIYLNGNAETATKATQDGNGNNIEETYAAKESLNAKKNVSYTTLPDGTDLNEVTTGGSYYLYHTSTYANKPSQLVNGFMDVMVYGSVVKQIVYRQGTIGANDWTIVERTGILSSGTWSWSDWVEVVTEKTGFAYGVKTTLANPTAKTSYYIPFVPGSSAGNKNIMQMQRGEFKIDSLEGTTAALGYDTLFMGNGIAEGTEGNKYGQLSLYSSSKYAGNIKPANLTANRVYTLPDKTGTFAMLSDVISSLATTSANGLMSATDKTKLSKIGFQVKKGTSVSIDAGRHCIAMGWVEDSYFCIADITTGSLTNIWYNGCSFSLSGNTLTLGSASSGNTHFIAVWQE